MQRWKDERAKFVRFKRRFVVDVSRKGETGHQRFGGGHRAAKVGGGGGDGGEGSKNVIGGPGRGDGKPMAGPEAVQHGR